MSNFVVSARKYRPKLFNEVVGQQAVTTTLRNALAQNKLAHAFLFTGPRGVGKTTCARILARTINCLQTTSDMEACLVCEHCQSFEKQNNFNFFELDAASNNSVDDIRNLIDNVRIAPQTGKYKVYIIDEVHMLSTAAFNAFLKTLEEPPHYAIFILATTDKHKVLPTVLSRCQIYDFSRVSNVDIAKHLEDICNKEHYKYDADALQIIAQKSDGGLRDALSMLDRLVSFTQGTLSTETVMENLNILDYQTFFNCIVCIQNNDLTANFLSLHQAIAKGFDYDDYLNGLADHCRNLLVAQHEGMIKLLLFTDSIKWQYQTQAQQIGYAFLINALAVLSNADVQYKTSKNKRLLAETTLIRLHHINQWCENKEVPDVSIKKKLSPENITSNKTTLIQENQKPEPIATKVYADNKSEIINVSKTTTLTQTNKLPTSLSDINLQGYQEQSEKEEPALTDKNNAINIDVEKAEKFISQFCEKLTTQGQNNKAISIQNTLKNWDGNELQYTANKIQKSVLLDIRWELSEYLQKCFNTPIRIIVNESKNDNEGAEEKEQEIIWSKRKIYDHMQSKNNNISLLHEVLNAEIK